ncbi:dfa3 [Symbiodinium sp. CCMP2592]|nr:dfa3 [Symbiodinium sp. CCMP2592]
MKKASISIQVDGVRARRKTFRQSGTSAKTPTGPSRGQEERDLIRALSEFAPQSLNAFDDAFNLLDGGMGVAVSAAMARRAALYGRGEQTLGGESRHILLSKLSSREAGGRSGFMDQVVDKLVKPKAVPKAAVEPKPGLAGLKRRGSGASGSRRPSGEWRRTDGVELDETQLHEWAKSWLQPSSVADMLQDFGRFQERITHRMRCWHAGQAGNGFVPLPVLPPVPPQAASSSRHLVPKRWRRPTSLRKGVGASDSLSSQHQHSFEEEDSESDLPLSPVKSQKDLSMLSVSTGFPSCSRSFHPHGVFREASIADSVPEQKLPLLRCPPEFQEPHRMPNCAALTATPEFLYLRVCELSGQLPCSEAWLHFGNGWGIIDASGRSLYDADLHALVRTAVICAAQGHPLRELNLSGNKMTDAGFQEVLALLQQFRSHVGREGRARWQSSESCELEEADGTLQLESLNVASNTMLHFRDAGLVQSLPASIASLTALTALDISFVPFNGRVAVSLARSLAKSCAVLRNLSLAGCGLGLCGQADCVALASLLGDCSQPGEAGFQGLERADFSGNFFGGAGFAAAAMAVGLSRIRSLAFAGNSNPPSSDMSAAEWSALLLLRQRSPDREVDKEREPREPAPAIGQIALAAGHNPLQLFLEGLQANSTLEELDLSSCSMGADSAWVLQEALRRHQNLKQLRLCDNPLGEQGLRYVLRLITEMDQHLQGADISGHRESDIRCPAVKYRHAQPSGNYRLNLSLPTDRAILRMLLCHADSHSSEMPHRFLKFDPKTGRPSVEKDTKGHWLVPTSGSWNVTYVPPLSEASYTQLKEAAAEDVHKPDIEQAQAPPSSPRGRSQVGRAKLDGSGDDALSIPQVSPMSHGTGHHGSVANAMEGAPQAQGAQVEKEKRRVVRLAPGLPGTPEGDWMEVHDLIQDCRAKVRAPAFNLFKQALAVMVTDEERLRFARALGKELWFTEAQVKVLTETSAEMAVQLVCFLFPALRSRRFQLALVQQITEPSKMTKVRDSVRHLLWFQDTNPTGSYNLDLSIPVDYALAECCLLVNAWESESARCAGRPDLSQSGNFEMIRNEAYNDVPFVYSKDWLLPSSGWLRFEYSSTRRPPPDATTMNEVSEITRLLRNKDLSSQSRLQALRAASVHLFISSNQCRALVQCFPSAPESSSQDAVNSGTDESPDRQEAFCILHTRVLDRERLLGPEVVYSPVVVQQIGMSHHGTSVLVRGGMFKTGELEMKSAEAQIPTSVATALQGAHGSKKTAGGRRGGLAIDQNPLSAYYNFLIVFKEQDVLALYRRLGVLHLLNPYKPEILRMPVDLSIHEQHRIVNFLVQLASAETGSRVLCWLDGQQVAVPASWADKGVPRAHATITVSYEGHNSSFAARQALAEQYCTGFWQPGLAK